MYRPNKPFNVPFMILNPTREKVNGKVIKKYPDEGELIYASFATFGGTQGEVNDVVVVHDTANIETWYRDDITSDTRIKNVSNQKIYEVLGSPENIEERNQFLKFKVERIAGKSDG